MYKSDSTHGYFPVKDKAITTGFYLTGAGMERVEANEPYPLPSHPDMYNFSWNMGRVLPEYALVYIDSGEGVFEHHPFAHQPILMGCLDNGIAHETEFVPTHSLPVEKYEIGPAVLSARLGVRRFGEHYAQCHAAQRTGSGFKPEFKSKKIDLVERKPLIVLYLMSLEVVFRRQSVPM